jgi:hypothetical protein
MSSQERLLTASTIVVAVTFAFVVAAPGAAASPHFTGTLAIGKNTNYSLTAMFTAVGVPYLPVKVFLTSSGGEVGLRCFNPSENDPLPKKVTFKPLQSQQAFLQPNNGQIKANSTIGPPPLPTNEICLGKNWDVKIAYTLTYFDVVLHIQQQNGQDILAFNYGNIDP